jgi:glycosyltransferase involved in cell wall biosynthesis
MAQNPADQPLVSIVLPTYNRAPLLGRAIQSVLRQTYANLELIVVDDNSQDETPAVVRSFDDPRIRYVRNEENLKLPRGLNKGFSLSKGTFLSWTSDDNLYAGDAIAKMAAVLQRGTCDFVFADYFHFSELDDKSGLPLDTKHVKLPAILRLEERNSVGACFLYTRAVYDAVGLYDPELFLIEDYDYFIRIQKLFRIGHIPEALYYFRRHEDALFCSRYAEVKAADVLVRYKNGLLDKGRAADACVELIMKDISGLRNPVLRGSYPILKRWSFRMTKAYERAVRRYVLWKLERRIVSALEEFNSRALSFRQASDVLRKVLQSVATIEYK